MIVKQTNEQAALSTKTKNLTEEKLKNYYRDKRELERQRSKLNMLCRHKEEVQKDISKANIYMNSDIQSVNYNKANVQTFTRYSIQERVLENGFARLEQRLELLDNEILNIKFSKPVYYFKTIWTKAIFIIFINIFVVFIVFIVFV